MNKNIPAMDTLEKSLVCRLCGKHCNISVNIFDKSENHVWKIQVILPITVHEMDFLPKQMCHRCSYKLEEFYNFYAECAKTDTDLKNQLSWMRKETSEEQIITPMVKMNPFKIKTEPPDCNDSNSSDVFGHISNFGSYDSPILTCSRCRCLCNTTVKISKSPPQTKVFSKEIENQPNNSNTNNCEKNDESSKLRGVNKKCQLSELINNNCSENNGAICKQINLKDKIPLVIIDSSECNTFQDQIDSTNRALRPRKGSIAYMGTKKKITHKLKEKFRNKEDIFDSRIVTPVEIKVTSSNSLHSNPIIKLEKVDDTLKNLRARKNLEEFNKKVKELGHTRRFHRDENLKNKFLRRLENRSRKSFLKEESLKISLHDKNQFKRKSLQLEENQIAHKFICASVSEKQAEQNLNKQILLPEKNSKNDNIRPKDHQTKKNSKNEKGKNIETLLNNAKARQSLMNKISQANANEVISQNAEIQIKQEVIVENDGNIEDLSVVSCETNALEKCNQKVLDSLQRLPKFPVVKLEKDYTCNVDYPRVKIVRHLTITDSAKSVDVVSKVSAENTTVLQDKVKKASLSEDKIKPKSCRKKDKKLKSILNKKKAGKVTKKKRKELNLDNVKKVVSDNGASGILHNEFKNFCEECDVCFRNRELFKLHPCYQK